jgi:hypothetical protein
MIDKKENYAKRHKRSLFCNVKGKANDDKNY